MLTPSTTRQAIETDDAIIHGGGQAGSDTRLDRVSLLTPALSTTAWHLDDAVLATVDRMGMKLGDLQVLFPSVLRGRMPAFATGGLSAR